MADQESLNFIENTKNNGNELIQIIDIKVEKEDYVEHDLGSAQEDAEIIEATSDKTKIKCPQCPDLLSSVSVLNRHMRKHTKVGPHKCPHCNKLFSRLDNLNDHIKRHNGHSTIPCDQCNGRFVSQSEYKRHYRIHIGVKAFKCDQCEKSFIDANRLQDHVKIHSSSRPFRCSLCEKGFIRNSDLNKHMKSHNKEKSHQCKDCGKYFIDLSHLHAHATTHAQDRRYQCDQCDRSFAYLCYLRRHYRTHSGEKPYICVLCEKGFGKINHLQRHMHVHSGKKPYQCELCLKSYTDIGTLKGHSCSVKKEAGKLRSSGMTDEENAVKLKESLENFSGDSMPFVGSLEGEDSKKSEDNDSMDSLDGVTDSIVNDSGEKMASKGIDVGCNRFREENNIGLIENENLNGSISEGDERLSLGTEEAKSEGNNIVSECAEETLRHDEGNTLDDRKLEEKAVENVRESKNSLNFYGNAWQKEDEEMMEGEGSMAFNNDPVFVLKRETDNPMGNVQSFTFEDSVAVSESNNVC